MERDLKRRAQLTELLVRTAEQCLEMNNYDSTMLIVSVLANSAVHRLANTWAEVLATH